MRNVYSALDDVLKAFGYAEQDGTYRRAVGGLNLIEFFQFVERTYWDGDVKHEVVKLYSGIFFPEWLPIRRTIRGEIKGTHWDGPVDQVVKDAKTEWDIHDSRELSVIEAEIRKACADVHDRYAKHSQNFRLYIAADQGEAAKDETIRIISTGIDVNDGGVLLLSPIDVAAYMRCMDTVKALIAAGADPNPRPGSKHSPADWSDYDSDRIGPSEVTTYLRSIMKTPK